MAKWYDAADRLISISTLPLCCPTSIGQFDLLLSVLCVGTKVEPAFVGSKR
jgi:hypothetical protein